jgi:predicted methyltransferase
MRGVSRRRSVRRIVCLACVCWGVALSAQDRAAQDRRREQWQKVDAIFAEMGVHPGAVVADIGAGDGFFTTRLAKAVGPGGRVFAVDIDDTPLARLRKRLQDEGIDNVTIVKGAVDDPKLPKAALDAALTVNAYHEMEQHQAMLTALRLALKPDGRLVIVEPVTPSRRNRPRADETKSHEIDPEYVVQDARAAGFAVLTLKDPFTRRADDVEWLLALQPGDLPPAPSAAAATDRADAEAAKDPALRMSLEDLIRLRQGDGATVVDVRSRDSFDEAHIPGAISIPLATIEKSVEHLRTLGKTVVTYCS